MIPNDYVIMSIVALGGKKPQTWKCEHTSWKHCIH